MEFIAGSDQHQKVIMFTSITPGSGKTFLTANIAASFAIKGSRAVAIDLDLRRASLSKYVGKPTNGISDYLNGRIDDLEEIVYPLSSHEGLDIIPVGTVPPNPAELLLNPRLAQLIQQLRQDYDVIFIDCPPVDIVADTTVISKLADITVFVIRVGLMDRDMLPVVEGYYNDKKFNNMTIILNGNTTGTSRYGYNRYSYHYGYGYGYGYGGYAKED
jgi:capsular exopolysaccharide synthesis family protein